MHADIAGCAGPVLNDKLLSQMIRQVVADDARHDVVGAAGRKRDDPAHRPRRIGLRSRHPRNGRQRGSACCQMQKLSTVGKFYFEPPFTSFDHLVGAAQRGGEAGVPLFLLSFYDHFHCRNNRPAFQPKLFLRPSLSRIAKATSLVNFNRICVVGNHLCDDIFFLDPTVFVPHAKLSCRCPGADILAKYRSPPSRFYLRA